MNMKIQFQPLDGYFAAVIVWCERDWWSIGPVNRILQDPTHVYSYKVTSLYNDSKEIFI